MDLPQTLMEAVMYFSNTDRCHDLLRDVRWPNGVVECLHCGSPHVRWMKSVKRWKCYERHAKPQFSVRIGTVFEESAVGLDHGSLAYSCL